MYLNENSIYPESYCWNREVFRSMQVSDEDSTEISDEDSTEMVTCFQKWTLGHCVDNSGQETVSCELHSKGESLGRSPSSCLVAELQRVALSGDVTAMNRMLNYTNSNTATLKELLAGECSLSNEMKVIIELKIDKIKLENVSMPMYIEKSDCNKLLNHYFYLAVKSVCCKEFQEENPILFHEACGYIFYLLTGKPISTLSAC